MSMTKSKILDEKLPVLIRESLGDRGEHSCENNSPDIIVQKNKLQNPNTLKNCYDQDVSQYYDGSGQMYLYVRLKNISAQTLNGIYVHLYRNHLGLYNHPKDWRDFEMHTESSELVYISSLQPGEIYVSPPFLYQKTNLGGNTNCFVAVATRERTPDYSEISTYEKYLAWINKPNVAARNVCVRKDGIAHEEQFFPVEGLHQGRSTIMGFKIEITECSASVKFGAKLNELNILAESTCSKPGTNSSYVFCSAVVPANYSGKLMVWYEASAGTRVTVDVTMWDIILRKPSAELEQYYTELSACFEDSFALTAVTEAINKMTDIPSVLIGDTETAASASSAVGPAYGTLLGGCILGRRS